MLPIQHTKEEEHVQMLLQRVRVANEHGRVKELRYWAGAYLNSFDARLAAVQTANRRRKPSDRLDTGTVRKIAAGLDPWKGTDEPVVVHLEKKDSTPVSFRTYMAFGIGNKALQYLALRLLEQVADITPHQYTVKGGTHAAIKHVANVMSTGPVWAVEIDVIDCYQSFDGKKLKDLLPSVPKKVSERVLISEHLNLKGGNIADIINSGPFGPAGDLKASVTLEGTLAAARRGIPQGSAASPLIAEIILTIALQAVPKLGDIVAYGDNCLLMAKEESDVVTMMEALETAFQAHPVGLLKPKRKLFKPGEPIDFLGHRLIPHHAKIRIEPSQKRQDDFEWKMKWQLGRLKYKKLSKAKRLRAKCKAIRCIQGWASAFCLCDGIGQYEAHWLTKVAEAFASSKKKKAICLL